MHQIRQYRGAAYRETRVIYFIDTDQYEINVDHAREFDEISRFCQENGYELVWFCHDVEEVFWGHKVSDSKKVKEAESFRRKRKIEELQIAKLSCDAKKTCSSNIIKVLDMYLARK